ncbi:hypothetical protein IF1G_07160 [Cordyceps javanica]|uniref:Uncharacterized protein n=1 Tax=Cordyceps javanica TaxID=43265 RepID=A0A545UXU0_9HYPO|nr:hypothetical protein IF1G_07160 [Cordyceps javanica]
MLMNLLLNSKVAWAIALFSRPERFREGGACWNPPSALGNRGMGSDLSVYPSPRITPLDARARARERDFGIRGVMPLRRAPPTEGGRE